MIGTIAACFTTLAFLPQVIKVVKTRNTGGLSLLMCLMQETGVFLWALHGYIIQDGALLIANCFTFILTSIILVYKIYGDVQVKKENILEDIEE